MAKSLPQTRQRILPSVALGAHRLARVVLIWQQRRRTRSSLADLDPHMLRDIGIEPAQAATEVRKPFWQA